MDRAPGDKIRWRLNSLLTLRENTLKHNLKFISLYVAFYLSGMILHFIFQRLMGDSFASMNLFVVAMSAMAISGFKEFKERLSLATMLMTSSVAALLNYLLLLALPLISRLLSYPTENTIVEVQELVLILALNFSACLVILRLGNKHWGLRRI